mmetsp:Transcript_5403/g.16032  ORF Transcript_5403/g.16032 Transcript_5403/m.16032 type:complete len:424 (+) Transcript_5403:459-1730(+)
MGHCPTSLAGDARRDVVVDLPQPQSRALAVCGLQGAATELARVVRCHEVLGALLAAEEVFDEAAYPLQRFTRRWRGADTGLFEASLPNNGPILTQAPTVSCNTVVFGCSSEPATDRIGGSHRQDVEERPEPTSIRRTEPPIWRGVLAGLRPYEVHLPLVQRQQPRRPRQNPAALLRAAGDGGELGDVTAAAAAGQKPAHEVQPCDEPCQRFAAQRQRIARVRRLDGPPHRGRGRALAQSIHQGELRVDQPKNRGVRCGRDFLRRGCRRGQQPRGGGCPGAGRRRRQGQRGRAEGGQLRVDEALQLLLLVQVVVALMQGDSSFSSRVRGIGQVVRSHGGVCSDFDARAEVHVQGAVHCPKGHATVAAVLTRHMLPDGGKVLAMWTPICVVVHQPGLLARQHSCIEPARREFDDIRRVGEQRLAS